MCRMCFGKILSICLFLQLIRTIYTAQCPNFSVANVVIFFTKPDTDANVNIEGGGISFLKFPVSGSVESSDTIPEQYRKLFAIDRESSDCNTIFNDCLMKLISWATNVKRMITATVSTTASKCSALIEKSFFDNTHARNGFEIYKYTIDTEPKRFGWNRFGKKLPVGVRDPGRDDESRKFIPDVYLLQDRQVKVPESSPFEVFGLGKNGDLVENVETRSGKRRFNKKAPNPNVFYGFDGVFSKLRDIFLNSFLNTDRNSYSEENKIDSDALGKVHDKPMFDLVKGTLKNLQSQKELYKQVPGFLMVVLGGKLSELSDPFSDLVQTVKYVLENTNDADTLILVTCFCSDGVLEKRKIPFYAIGPNSQQIANARNVFDMFDQVRASMKRKWSKYHGKKKSAPISNRKPMVERRSPSILNLYDENNLESVLVGRERRSTLSAAVNTYLNITFTIYALVFLGICYYYY